MRARGVEAGIDRPDTIFGEHVDRVFHRIPRLVCRFFDDRHDFRLVAKHGAIGLDHRGGGIAQERAVAGDPLERGAVGVEHVIGHEIGELNEGVQSRLLLFGQIHVLGMQRDAVDLSGEHARQAAGSGRGDELRVIHRQPGGAQDFAAHAPVEATHPAAGRAELFALEVGGGLHVGRHQVGLRHSRRQAPELLHLHAAADGYIAHAHDGGALRGGGIAAFELDDVGLDAALGEEAEFLGHVRRGVHHVGRRDRNADIDLAHRAAALRDRAAACCVGKPETDRRKRHETDRGAPLRHHVLIVFAPDRNDLVLLRACGPGRYVFLG